MNILGIFHSYSDPSAALIKDGNVVAFVEEERLLRIKHAVGYFPLRSIDYVLKAGNLDIDDIDYIAQAWDCDFYDSGKMAEVYKRINSEYPTDEGDLSYQRKHLSSLSASNQSNIIYHQLRKNFGDRKFPPVIFVKHHFAHACMAYYGSAMEEALILTIDGSGENVTTAWWAGRRGEIELLKEVEIPHSLGWFYSAFTEYLGFQAYDGEYKVMGLASYGHHDPELREKLSKLVWYDGEGGFLTDPMMLSRGERNFSYYFPDSLIEFIGKKPRCALEEISQWHKNLAYEVQFLLEGIVKEMLEYWVSETGLGNLVIGGGVGLNVKMNGNLFASGLIEDIFVHPLCADSGISIGGALALLYEKDKNMIDSRQLETISLGPSFSDNEIEKILRSCKLNYSKKTSIEREVAELLSEGKIVGWFQGGMEAGPRALGNRSILADPRYVKSRDKVNEIIKFRELWRPFCPSMTPNGRDRYLADHTDAPFMITTFMTKDIALKEVPAIVHVDGSTRPQVVEKENNKMFFNLINEFEKITGIPCVLNTSFNVKGEPIVCSPHDAIRTFSATGLDVLAIGPFLVEKPEPSEGKV